ncbi:TolC family protein [Sulfurimonas sp. SAG-AH-194-L11]|nr:TolC family protein [Sulfurimonas sp. SAG-AH-194-L11]MDF1876305.1 TolC family protein [Sulfurimonas sp. SAG-AH-194-L11]
MKKLFLVPLLIGTLQAQNFEAFLAESVQKSPLLKTNVLSLEQAQEKATLTTRYKNPTLSLQVSNFSLDTGNSEVGYSAGISQPIRLWGVSGAREDLAKAQTSQVKAGVKLSRANFVKKLSSLYAKYKRAVGAESLAKEELAIAQNIAKISQSRFENGTISRVKYIQASLDAKRVQNFLAQTQVVKTSAYYRMMGYRGLSQEVEVDTEYDFSLSKLSEAISNAQIELSRARTKSAQANAELNANKLEWVSLYGQFEQEPDQSIARVGVNLPLVVFNTKSQEKQIAKLSADKEKLVTQNLTQQLTFKLRELQNSIQTLEVVEKTLKELLLSQKELLAMYEEGYKIANINLIELQNIKNQLINTKENLLNITLSKELNIIQHNYLTGSYNE